MSPGDGSGDSGFTRVIIAVVVVLGITTAGSLARFKPDTGQAGSGATASVAPTPSGSDTKPSSAPSQPAVFDASGRLRPLWSLRRFLGAESLFRGQGSPDNAPPTPFEKAATEAVNNEPDAQPVDEAIFGSAPTREDRAAIHTAVQKLEAQGIHSQVLVAALPDWVDSSLQWTFDSMLDAIQMSAAQMGYVLTAFDLPDSKGTSVESPTPEKTARSLRRIHESVPGSLLFRRVAPDKHVDLLLILLVGETTTDGLHARALGRALDLALIWDARAVQPEQQVAPTSRGPASRRAGGVAILGPTYSGSVLSLQRGLKAAAERNHLDESSPDAGVWFEVVTPSASNPSNPSYLDVKGRSTFGAVTRSDDETLDALARYMAGIKKEWRCGDGVALLVEATTPWGLGLLNQPKDKDAATAAEPDVPEACRACRAGRQTAADGASAAFPCATYVPFPLHISRLRSEAQRSGVTTDIQLADSAVVRLDLDEAGTAIDRIAPATPALTAATVELMVDGIFRAIDDRKYSAIGVIATDKRDHVFLAQEIARHRPNVLPFTIESSLLYLHPDVRSYVRGTLIASTYSLSTRAQTLTDPARAQMYTQQFGSNQAHGAYNALALLLGDPEKMLDYRTPAGPGELRQTAGDQSPSVWISVAAKGGLLPLTAVISAPDANCHQPFAAKVVAAKDGAPRDGYVRCVSRAASGSAAIAETESVWSGRYLGSPPPLVIVVAVLFVLLAAHQAVLSWGWKRRAADAFMADVDTALGVIAGHERAASRVALRAATLTIGLWVMKMEAIYVADLWQRLPMEFFGYYAYAVLVVLCVLYVAWDVITRFWYAPGGAIATASNSRRPVLVARIAAILFVVLIVLWAAGKQGQVTPYRPLLVLLAIIALLIAVSSDLFPASARELADRVAQWRRVPALLGLAAFICLGAHLLRDGWQPVDAILYFDRNVNIGDLASPATFIVLSAAALYWWGAWNLRRLKLLELPETEIGIGAFLQGRAHSAGIDPHRLRQPALTMGCAIMIPGAAVLAVAYGHRYASSIEQFRFDAFLYLASACILTAMCHTLAHSVNLGRTVLNLLRAVARHPAVKVVKRLAKEPFEWHMTYTEPHRTHFEPLVRRIERIEGMLVQLSPQDLNLLFSRTGDLARLGAQVATFVRQMSANGPVSNPAQTPQLLLDAGEWRALDTLVFSFHDLLCRTKWLPTFAAESLSKTCRVTLDQMEIVVMFHAAIVLRDLLTRLVSGFSAVAGGLLLLLAGHLFYTFEGRVYWLGLDAIAIALTAFFAIRKLVALERDTVLSTLWATEPGKIPLFGKLTWRVGIYVLVALITLFAAFFPELGGQFVKWVEPARHLIAL